jgi:hypothetical protein
MALAVAGGGKCPATGGKQVWAKALACTPGESRYGESEEELEELPRLPPPGWQEEMGQESWLT